MIHETSEPLTSPNGTKFRVVREGLELRTVKESGEVNALIKLGETMRELHDLQNAVRAVLAEPYLLDPGCAEDQALVDKLKELVQ